MSNPNPRANPCTSPQGSVSSAMDYDKLDADTRSGTVDALAEATALHLRMLGRWQPGTLTALLAGGSR
jgi:hypothetical protein